MCARPAVLLNSLDATLLDCLLSYKQNTPVTHLESTLAGPLLKCCKQRTYNPFRIRTYKIISRNPFRCNTYKKRHGRVLRLNTDHRHPPAGPIAPVHPRCNNRRNKGQSSSRHHRERETYRRRPVSKTREATFGIASRAWVQRSRVKDVLE